MAHEAVRLEIFSDTDTLEKIAAWCEAEIRNPFGRAPNGERTKPYLIIPGYKSVKGQSVKVFHGDWIVREGDLFVVLTEK